MTMKVELKCFATLENPQKCESKESIIYEIEIGQSVENLIQLAGINNKEIKIIFVNNRLADFDTVLCDGDRVGLAPTAASLNDPHSCINKATQVNCGDW